MATRRARRVALVLGALLCVLGALAVEWSRRPRDYRTADEVQDPLGVMGGWEVNEVFYEIVPTTDGFETIVHGRVVSVTRSDPGCAGSPDVPETTDSLGVLKVDQVVKGRVDAEFVVVNLCPVRRFAPLAVGKEGYILGRLTNRRGVPEIVPTATHKLAPRTRK